MKTGRKSTPRTKAAPPQPTVVVPGLAPFWLKVTSKNTGRLNYLPLPIRLIQQIPDEEGGGCIVTGAHGDMSTAKESIIEILDLLGGYAIGGASAWSIAG